MFPWRQFVFDVKFCLDCTTVELTDGFQFIIVWQLRQAPDGSSIYAYNLAQRRKRIQMSITGQLINKEITFFEEALIQ
jgi:hypothetical protein